MKKIFLLFTTMLLSLIASAQGRQSINLKQWQFSRDSVNWQPVTIPHDWAISGPFDKKWDLQTVAIVQNGEKEKTEKSGRSGALPWIGKGYYTTKIRLKDIADDCGTIIQSYSVFLYFDGAMAEPHVYVNGHLAGYWAYGYSPFKVDITPFLINGDNTISVSLQNVDESSRWYPGAGLYRPVTLEIVPRTHLDAWKTFITTPKVENDKATVCYETTVAGNAKGRTLNVVLKDENGRDVAAGNAIINNVGKATVSLDVDNPKLWSPETPYLYICEASIAYGVNNVIDKQSTKVGIRTICIDSIHGFQLNGVSRKIKGVCLHHDLGPLGAAVNKAALIRQVKQLKDMGADAIRTSHNLPSQMQMEVYDSLGMMVMAESFDMWIYPKCKNGYARFFKDWSDKDIEALVRANRNHPSLIMYSIGNEVPEQLNYEGKFIAEHLQNICHKLDPTRPVTQGMDRVPEALRSGFAQTMDIPAFNYRVFMYEQGIKKLNTGYLLGSETASTVSSRGIYKFPVKWSTVKKYNDGQCTSYDTEWCSWSNLPEEDFMAQEDNPYTIGQFVWTGYDYLGEPTPYDEYWPSRSSYFGIMDLAGLPKDRFYLYRSVWNKKEHTLHILPHWTWPGREGKATPVFVYTDYPEAELFVNGKSQGRVKKDLSVNLDNTNGNKSSTPEVAEKRAKRYRLMWDSVKNEPGEIKVVAYDKDGNKAAETSMRTAGKAKALKLEADRTTLQHSNNSETDDLAYITVSLVDANGTELPTADDEIDVQVNGAGSFQCICNGDATSLEVFTKPTMKLFSGKLVITVKAGSKKGTMNVKVTDKAKKLSKTINLKVF